MLCLAGTEFLKHLTSGQHLNTRSYCIKFWIFSFSWTSGQSRDIILHSHMAALRAASSRGGQGGGHELPRWPRPGLVLGRPIHPGLPRTIPLFSLKSCVPGHPKSLANGDSWRCCLVLSGTCLVPAHLRAWPLRHCFSHAQVPPQNDGQGCPPPESCFPPAPCHVL